MSLPVAPARPAWLFAGRRRPDPIRVASFTACALAAAFLAGLVGLLTVQSLPVWRHEGVVGFLGGHQWFFRARTFGALPMIYGTVMVSAVALVLAVPVGLGAALFASEVLPPRARLGLKTVIELLAGVPSVVYGLLGVLLLRDWMYRLLAPFDPLSGDTLLTAGVLLAVMVLPTVTTFSEDALRGVPGAQRRAARGLGLHPLRILWRHLLPNALTPVLVQATLAVGDLILAESALSFLGLGVQPPTASWGNMVADGRDVLLTAWWVSTFPGLAIVGAVVTFNLLGDRLRDVLDPRTRGSGRSLRSRSAD